MKFKSDNSFSNSKFKLINLENKIFLRKFLKSVTKRSIDSVKKQNNFKAYKLNDFDIISAKIKTSYKDIKKKNYYDMHFYYGKSGDEILKSSNVKEIILLRNWISNRFFSNKIYSFYRLDPNIYIIKLDEIIKKIKNNFFLKIFLKIHIPQFKRMVKKKKIFYPQYKLCHGDLTLSNIIIDYSKKKLILIDFLKTYNENIIQDYAKLYQEFKLGWSGRHLGSIKNTRSSIIYENIINNNQWNELDIRLKKAIIIETYMTLFRILPYLNPSDENTLKWILTSFKQLNKSIKSNNL